MAFVLHQPIHHSIDQPVVLALEKQGGDSGEVIERRPLGAMGKHHGKHGGHDVEACHPGGYMIESPQLQWAFIRKVYSIVTLQLLVTVAVAAAVNLIPAVRAFFLARTAGSFIVFIILLFSPLILLIPLMCFQTRHPINLILLALFTICISFSVGLSCLSAKGVVVFEAAAITLVVVAGLTAYTFWAARRGHDFAFLGPFLFAACLVLMLYAIVMIFFPMGKTAMTVYACIATLLFSAFIIYDTDNLIKRYTYGEYVPAAITLYLDIVNLFRSILMILQATE